MFGFLNIYKPIGMTSHDVVGYLRRVTKIKQIGHTGTLDPFAEGVLPIAIGKATRLIEYLNDDKAYIGRFCFGKSTDTYDIEGVCVKTYKEKVSEKDVIKSLSDFHGVIEQYPPIYSAKKVNGKKLYEYARENKEVEIKPCKVNIYDIKLLEFNEDEQWADIYTECSKGTYIRSIANDLGQALENGCYLSKLKRVKAGLFGDNGTIKLKDLKTAEDVSKNLLNPIDYLPLPKIEIDINTYDKVIHGMPAENSENKSGVVMLVYNNKLAAVGEARKETVKVRKVII